MKQPTAVKFCAGGAGCLRQPILFCLARNSNVQPLFLCAVKKKPLAVKRKPAKGDLRRNKLHIPHPVRRLRRTGVVRSVVPPFPTRIAALDSRGSPVPFAIPLKRPRRGLRPPSLDFPRSLVCAEIIFGFIKRDADAYWTDRRCSRNTLRLFRMYLARKSACARYAWPPL